MRVVSGAWVSRARLQATDGAPIPTKHTSSFFSVRAAATAIISAVEYCIGLLYSLLWLLVRLACRLAGKDMFLHPGEKCLAVSCNCVPGSIEGVVAAVIAMGIGWVCTSRCLDDSTDGPIRENDSIRAWNAQVVYDLFHGHEHSCCCKCSFLLNPDNPLKE